jgi:hypothetical protein
VKTLASAVLALLAPSLCGFSSVHAQDSKEVLLARTAAYVQRFVDDFANVVAEEEYTQEFRMSGGRRRLKSDFLFVRSPGEERLFQTFRDVLEVNGRPVSDQQERLTRLFLEPFQSAIRRASEISRAAERHGDNRGRLVDPLQVIAFLQSEYQPNFEFELRGSAPALGNGVREVRFNQPVEVALRGAVANLLAWIEEPTGRVLKTELRTGIGAATRITTTTFGFDTTLRINVPVEMRDAVPVGAQDEFLGRARYRNFRRFSVEARESIEIPVNRP